MHDGFLGVPHSHGERREYTTTTTTTIRPFHLTPEHSGERRDKKNKKNRHVIFNLNENTHSTELMFNSNMDVYFREISLGKKIIIMQKIAGGI